MQRAFAGWCFPLAPPRCAGRCGRRSRRGFGPPTSRTRCSPQRGANHLRMVVPARAGERAISRATQASCSGWARTHHPPPPAQILLTCRREFHGAPLYCSWPVTLAGPATKTPARQVRLRHCVARLEAQRLRVGPIQPGAPARKRDRGPCRRSGSSTTTASTSFATPSRSRRTRAVQPWCCRRRPTEGGARPQTPARVRAGAAATPPSCLTPPRGGRPAPMPPTAGRGRARPDGPAGDAGPHRRRGARRQRRRSSNRRPAPRDQTRSGPCQ